MGDEVLGLVHYAPQLPHQVRLAGAFKACGFGTVGAPGGDARVHVVLGPHFALDAWRKHPRVLWVDRAWWGDPDAVSIGWLQPDGSRKFATGKDKRPVPKAKPWKDREQSALVLADYRQDVHDIVSKAKQRFGYVRVRRHPAEQKSISLASHLELSDVVIGTSGTALFDGVMAGLPGICLDPRNPCAEVCDDSMDAELVRPNRRAWLQRMAYKQFTTEEIRSGYAWRHLENCIGL